MTIEIIDIGANLTHDSFDDDRKAVVEAALQAGVSRMIITGSTASGSDDALALARQWPAVMYSTAGVHPHRASEYDGAVHAHLRSLLQAPEVVSVGECGLDYFRDFSPREDQRMAFERQLDLAIESGLPVFLHQRDAHEDFMKVLAPRLQGISRAVAHCFTGTEDELRAYIDHDLYIGVTGWICDERRGTHLREIVRLIPVDRLMIETDAPYLLPRTLDPKPKSRRNEPRHLTEVLRIVAQSLDADPEEIGRQTTANAQRFFAIA